MKLIDKGEEPGSATKASEDRCGISGNVAWVIDGASDFGNECNLPAASNVQWLVDTMQECLYEHGSERRHRSSDRLLYEIQREISTKISRYDLTDMQQYPCCSLAVLVTDGDMLQVSRVGDAAAFLLGPARLTELSTDFFDSREAEAVAMANARKLSREEVTRAMYDRREEYIHGIAGESVFSGHPETNLFVHTLVVGKNQSGFLLMTTDGLTRAVSEYGIFPDWLSLVGACRKLGISQVIDEVRTYERRSVNQTAGKFKKSDDIAALLLEV